MENNKTHWKKVFNSDYLGACDLEDNKDLKATIKSVTVKTVKSPQGKDEERNVASFTDSKIKPMILNVTNCKVVKKFAKSPFIQDWVNIPISIYVKGDIKAFGDITEGLRIREVQPKLGKPELLPTSEAWANAVAFLKGKGTMEQIKAKYVISAQIEEQLKTEVLK